MEPNLAPGERGRVMCIATDRKQAGIIYGYIRAFFEEVPILSDFVENWTKEVLELKNNINVEVHTATYRGIRGYAVIAALFDEIAFFRSEETTNPDKEILDALRPGMSSVPGSMLLCASSPYAKKGVLCEAFKDHFGEDNRQKLVWKAPTWIMNPTIPHEYLEEQYAKDPYYAAAEFGAEFRSDVEFGS